MKKTAYIGHNWPTPYQTLLLRASLCRGEEAINAWHEWGRDYESRELEGDSFRLLPLLYYNLRRLGLKGPAMDKLRGVYKRAWYDNQLLLHRLSGVLKTLAASGIETMVLKGAALSVMYYPEPWLRPMTDVDILVPSSKVRSTMEVLQASGHRPEHRIPESLPDFTYALSFMLDQTRVLDLHCRIMLECRWNSPDEDLWRGALPLDILGATTLALNPTDQLLHVCVNATRWENAPQVRWIADAVTIMNKSEIDWNHLKAQALKLHLVLPLRETLHYLHFEHDAPIPPHLLEELRRLAVTRFENNRHKAFARPHPLLGALPVMWLNHRLSTPNLRTRLLGFPAFLQYVFQLDSLREVPGQILHKALKRLLHRASPGGRVDPRMLNEQNNSRL